MTVVARRRNPLEEQLADVAQSIEQLGKSRLVAIAVVAVLLFLIYYKISSQSSPAEPSRRRVSFIEPVRDFEWQMQEPRQLRPIKPNYYMTMGLQNDTPDNLITMDRDYLSRVNLRRVTLAKYPGTAHGVTPQGVPAVKELYSYLMSRYLPSRYPSIFHVRGGQVENSATESLFPICSPQDPLECLRNLAVSVEEDMFLLQATEKGHQCVAFVCCFPSGFNPSTKMGQLLSGIHGDVPSYEKIGPSMERFFSRIEVGQNVKRTNWSVQTHAELFNCDANIDLQEPKDSASVDPSKSYFRVELQTLSRLPNTQAILFSFKTYMYPMQQIKDEGTGPDLADAIEGLQRGNAIGMWKYKKATIWAEPICKFLRS